MADSASTIVAASVLFRLFTCFIDDIYLKRKYFPFSYRLILHLVKVKN